MHLEHVNLTVGDLDRSIRFYTQLLGWRVRWKGTTSSGTPAAHVGSDDTYLAFFEGDGRGPAWNYGRVGFNHLGFVVEDMDAALAQLKAQGATVHGDDTYDPGRHVYFEDPDGYEVELVAYAPADEPAGTVATEA